MNKLGYLEHTMEKLNEVIRNTVMVEITAEFPDHSDDFVEKTTNLFNLDIGECVTLSILDKDMKPSVKSLLKKVHSCVVSNMLDTKKNYNNYK
jgi:hypothetical protein